MARCWTASVSLSLCYCPTSLRPVNTFSAIDNSCLSAKTSWTRVAWQQFRDNRRGRPPYFLTSTAMALYSDCRLAGSVEICFDFLFLVLGAPFRPRKGLPYFRPSAVSGLIHGRCLGFPSLSAPVCDTQGSSKETGGKASSRTILLF